MHTCILLNQLYCIRHPRPPGQCSILQAIILFDIKSTHRLFGENLYLHVHLWLTLCSIPWLPQFFRQYCSDPSPCLSTASGKQSWTVNITRSHEDVIKWKHFPRNWPFVRGIHRSPVNSPHKGQWHGALMFSLICAWTNGWVNNGEAGDLINHRAHYDVTVMVCVKCIDRTQTWSSLWV